ncbi:DUF1990 domain-containing protein [Candidatus Gracilibacteria bacterium]|nr:DUF1990 domain-containing protein [Candidatus Gracilibacteria bacterium]
MDQQAKTTGWRERLRRRERRELWQVHQREIDALTGLKVNFDLERQHEYTAANGWRVDDHEGELPNEPPGQPVPGGPWELACAVLREYRFPDPGLITGIFYPDRPLGERLMLLRGRFLFFTFYFGVKIVNLIDTTITTSQGDERRWGFSYQTLEGHFERGQIDFAVVKNLQNGAVRFRIHSFSQTGHIRNIFYRIGFRLFGRRLQLRFARTALKRMQMLVQEDMQRTKSRAEKLQEQPDILPAGAEKQAQEKLEDVQKQIEK